MNGQFDPIELMKTINELENKISALATIQTGGIWNAYTPTVTYSGGTTDPTTATVAGKYSVIGEVCIVQITYQITTIGSGDRTITNFTLPINYSGNAPTGSSQSNITAAGIVSHAVIGSGGNSVNVYHGAMSTTGYVRVTVTYEI